MAVPLDRIVMVVPLDQMVMVVREAMKSLVTQFSTNAPRRTKLNVTPLLAQFLRNIAKIEVKKYAKSLPKEYQFLAKDKTVTMKRKKFASWNKGHNQSKLRSTSTPNSAAQFPRPSVTTLFTCIWSQFVFPRLEKNVVTTPKKNARTYQRSTATKYHIRSSIWNVTRAMEVIIHTEPQPLNQENLMKRQFQNTNSHNQLLYV